METISLNKKRILFIDLDDTLIKTASGKTFPEDITDFRIRLDVLNKIKENLPSISLIQIVSNQGGIPQYVSDDGFNMKISCILEFLQRWFGNDVNVDYVYASSKSNPNWRKPNVGMLDISIDTWKKLDMFPSIDYDDKDLMIMIGDASGKPEDFSDSDKKCAENYGIDYIDVDDFLNL